MSQYRKPKPYKVVVEYGSNGETMALKVMATSQANARWLVCQAEGCPDSAIILCMRSR